MSEVIIDKHQAIIDVAIQETGDASSLFDIALANALGITDEVVSGTVLSISGTVNEKAFKFLKPRKIRPVTILPKDDDLVGAGIEFWGIEFDFIIN